MTTSTESAFRNLPHRVWQKALHLPTDLLERWTYRNSMIPPQSMIFIGSGDFEQIGLEFRKYFIDLAQLQPGDKVLDVGCGLGRMAVPLTSYLSTAGEYQGFDIVKNAVDWCTHHIARRFDHFHFRHSDVYNQHYNPRGAIAAKDFRFPFADAYFDFVLLTSVFTHMLPSDMERYLGEISRVLKPGGTCFITFFLLNAESRELIDTGHSTLSFSGDTQAHAVADKADPEAAVAYREAFIRELFAKYALEISPPIRHGSWCGREKFLSYQDIVIARKSS